ncbi:hypothetical protein PCASD_22102 [Puccinia coronata f. sp. avenae]|uniref:Core-binding (CB) domain-containing protein n=1 Tax=Puccinia coronata f. sp. avenae TaxID=200324 RepID=A0A2N5SX08_9BASI|nr:hypothetical protein PCASD_22102 [Puccinia coronata f. sp. avenae]
MNRQTVERKYYHFLSKDLSGPHPSRLNIHLLNAWQESTLDAYNLAVKRVVNFLRTKNHWQGLPLWSEDLWDFCLKVGHTMDDTETIGLASKNLQHYLSGVRAWHAFHGERFPQEATERLNLIIWACARANARFPPQHLKKAVHIRHLVFLAETLHSGTNKDWAILDCALVAFWGMARLKELTNANPFGMPRRAD